MKNVALPWNLTKYWRPFSAKQRPYENRETCSSKFVLCDLWERIFNTIWSLTHRNWTCLGMKWWRMKKSNVTHRCLLTTRGHHQSQNLGSYQMGEGGSNRFDHAQTGQTRNFWLLWKIRKVSRFSSRAGGNKMVFLGLLSSYLQWASWCVTKSTMRIRTIIPRLASLRKSRNHSIYLQDKSNSAFSGASVKLLDALILAFHQLGPGKNDSHLGCNLEEGDVLGNGRNGGKGEISAFK